MDMLDIVAVSEATICLDEALKTGRGQSVDLLPYVKAIGSLRQDG
jgi:hypothetical protein